MKITAVFLLAACLHVSAKSAGQNVTLSKKDATLQEIFREIEQQTGYQFFYKEKVLDGTKPVSIDVSNATLEKTLAICFKDQSLSYTMIDKIIVITVQITNPNEPKEIEQLSAPPIDISGKVTDADGNPLAGANIKVRGKNQSTITDANGVFVLKGVDDEATLEVSFAEYETQTLKVGKRTSFILSLKRQITSLNEVIVNKGYYTEKARNSLGNVTTVKSAEIEKQPVQNPLLALQGRVPGLQVSQLTGATGGGVTVRIQGRNSIQSGLNPLIVIDGMPFPSELTVSNLEDEAVRRGSPLNYVNPLDIESISILKDADATAIFGSRAANGAILITTKKGKAGKTEISFNFQQGWGKVTRKVDMMNTRQYLDMRYEAFRNDGIDWTNPSIIANDLKLWDTTRYTDWQKVLIGGTAQYTNLSTSVSGGTSNVRYLFGANYNRQTTVFPDDFDDQRGTVHLSINGSSTNQKFRIGMSAVYLYDKNKLPLVDLTPQAVLLHPNAPPMYTREGNLNWALNAAGNSTWDNPINNWRHAYFSNTTRNLVSNLQLSYTLLPGLNIRSSFGYTDLQSDINNRTFLEYFRPERRSRSRRQSHRGLRSMNAWILEPQLEYKGQFFSKGKIEGLLGATIQQNNTDVLSLLGSGYSSDFLMETFTGAAISTTVSSKTMYRYMAMYGRINYVWAEKYLFNFTARNDGSSRFGHKNKTHTFWSLAAGWIFSEEKWISENLPILSFGKLRGSYGTTGNDQIPNYRYLATYQVGGSGGGISYQNVGDLRVTEISNPHLKWEETHKLQVGIDVRFFNDRLELNASYNRNRTYNQITEYVLPIMTGFSNIVSNLPATIQNTSWEFILSSTPVKRKHFEWVSSLNFTLPRNKLASFPNIENTPYGNPSSGVIVGHPLGSFQAFRYAGVDPNTGNYQIFDKHGNQTATPTFDDFTELIVDQQDFYGGWQNSFAYKSVQLDFLFQYVYQQGPRDLYYYNNNLIPGVFDRGQSNQPRTVLQRWQKPGDNAVIGRYSTGNNYLVFPVYSDVGHNYDASFIRLKNLSLSWQLPHSWIKGVGLQFARIYMQAQNLVTITKYSGLDPETGGLVLPPLQMLTIGAQIKF